MTRAALLYSGGKDSSLAAVLLSRLGFELTLCTVSFGVNGAWETARDAAAALGFDHERLVLGREVLEEACRLIVRDGFPRDGINLVHRAALEEVAARYPAVADGTRRDDRAPRLGFAEIRSLEDRHGTEYIAPLAGIGHRTLNRLAGEMFILEEGESRRMAKGDYEAEIWAFMEERGLEPGKFFPRSHIQSRVLGYRRPGKPL
ncbi:MAG: hypothetical protein GXO65_02760 [Euryarchaeota archaeon]|nr:hypothetical protein [Euryarchaeota archaeon]